jgi:hypothetical protein
MNFNEIPLANVWMQQKTVLFCSWLPHLSSLKFLSKKYYSLQAFPKNNKYETINFYFSININNWIFKGIEGVLKTKISALKSSIMLLFFIYSFTKNLQDSL